MVSRSHRGGRTVLRQPSGPVLANKGVGTLTLGCSVSLLTLLSVTLPRGHLGVTLSILPGPNEETKDLISNSCGCLEVPPSPQDPTEHLLRSLSSVCLKQGPSALGIPLEGTLGSVWRQSGCLTASGGWSPRLLFQNVFLPGRVACNCPKC